MPQYGHSLKTQFNSQTQMNQKANDFFFVFDREPTINGNRGDLRYI